MTRHNPTNTTRSTQHNQTNTIWHYSFVNYVMRFVMKVCLLPALFSVQLSQWLSTFVTHISQKILISLLHGLVSIYGQFLSKTLNPKNYLCYPLWFLFTFRVKFSFLMPSPRSCVDYAVFNTNLFQSYLLGLRIWPSRSYWDSSELLCQKTAIFSLFHKGLQWHKIAKISVGLWMTDDQDYSSFRFSARY